MGLPDILTHKVNKKEITTSASKNRCREDLTKPHWFMKHNNLDECRMGMRLKAKVLDMAGDMPGK